MSSGCTRLADLAEGHQVVARRQAQDREHRMRPEDAAAREVPVPQAAAAAVERGVDAAAHGVVDHVGLARARRLPVEGKAQDQQHEAGGGGERHGQRGVGAPGARARRCAAGRRVNWPRPAASVRTVANARLPSASAISQHAGAGAEDGERLRFAEHVEQAQADRAAGRRGRGDDAVGVAQQDAAAERGGARRQRAFEQVAPRGVAVFGARPAGRSARRRSRRCCRCRGSPRRSPGGGGRAPARRRRRRW